MRKTRRYSLKIKDAQGSIVLAAVAVWDGHDRRAAVAKILRLDGVLEAPLLSEAALGEDVATNLDVGKNLRRRASTICPFLPTYFTRDSCIFARYLT
jgi:hypothetical protein